MIIYIGEKVYKFPCGGDINLLKPDEIEMLNEYNRATNIIDKINSSPNFNTPLVFWYRGKEITYTAEEVRNLDVSYDPEDEDALLP
ncbi:hypothetical protein ABXT08_16295 [Chryseobacterium sp. NRRL B-14859]|uniref:hypothetical protein n=1 Tax=Chryseobacterium sp. NRRL B-14859 TaxID=1562763 RepID=UPI003396B96B